MLPRLQRLQSISNQIKLPSSKAVLLWSFVALCGFMLLRDAVARYPYLNDFFADTFLSQILGAADPLKGVKLSNITDNYHRCQNKLGFISTLSVDDIYSQTGGILNPYGASPSPIVTDIREDMSLMYAAGARFITFNVNLFNTNDAAAVARTAAEVAKLAKVHHLKAIFISGTDGGSRFINDQNLHADFWRQVAENATESVEFVATTAPRMYYEQGRPIDAKSHGDFVAEKLLSFKNLIAAPAPLMFVRKDGCTSLSCKLYETITIDSDASLIRQAGLMPDLSLYDIVIFGIDNYDIGFKSLDPKIIPTSKARLMAYAQYEEDARNLLLEYNGPNKAALTSIIMDLGPGSGTFVGSQNLLNERLGYDYGKLSDEPTIQGIVVSRELYNLAGLDSTFYHKLNLYGTNCNYDLIDYQAKYDEKAAAIAYKTEPVTTDTGKARTRFVCITKEVVNGQPVGYCEAKIQFTTQVGLPIRHLGSNSAIGTDTNPYMPVSPRVNNGVNIPSDFLNQFSGRLTGSNGVAYSMPWLGSALNSTTVGLRLMNQSNPYPFKLEEKLNPGSYPTFAGLEQAAESSTNPIFNVWSYGVGNSAVPFNLRDEAALCVGKELCFNKILNYAIDDLRAYDPIKHQQSVVPVEPAQRNTPYSKRDPQNMVYGSEQVISEEVKSFSLNGFAYEVARGRFSSNTLRYQIKGGCTCLDSRGRSIPFNSTNAKRCVSELSPEDINKCVAYQSGLETYAKSDAIFEASFPATPTYKIEGVYDGLSELYNTVQGLASQRGEKLVFNEDWVWEADVNLRAYSVVPEDSQYKIESPRKNNMLEFFSHGPAVAIQQKSSTGVTPTDQNEGNQCKVGINYAILAPGLNQSIIDQTVKYGYSHGLVITTGAAGERQGNIDALNNLCDAGIVPMLRSCYTGVCEFTNGTQQANYLNDIINSANKCSKVYATCGHNEPVPENPNGMVNEGAWTRDCAAILKNNSKAAVTTSVFNATHPGLEQHLTDFFAGYGAFNKSDYACVGFNTYTFVDGNGPIQGQKAIDWYNRIMARPEFAGMNTCIMETGVAFPQPGQTDTYVGQVISELEAGSAGKLDFMLGFNWMGTNTGGEWGNFTLTEENNEKVASCQLSGGTLGNYQIPGKYNTTYASYLAEGKNWHEENHYYKMLGLMDELSLLYDTYVLEAGTTSNISRDLINWRKCDDPLVKSLEAQGKKVNCIAPAVRDPRSSLYVNDPLGTFLCKKGYFVNGEACDLQCKPPESGDTEVPPVDGDFGSAICHPGTACDATLAAGKGGYTYPTCRDAIRVQNTDTFCGSLREVNGRFGTGSDNIFNESIPLVERLKMAEDAGENNSETIGIFGTFMAANRGSIQALRKVEADISQWRSGEVYNFPSGQFKFTSYGGFNRRAEQCALGSTGNPGLNCLSMHSFGLAFDFNGDTNPFFASTRQCGVDMPPEFVQAMERNGFRWGGRFGNDRFDPMHFEYNPWCISGDINQDDLITKTDGTTTPPTQVICIPGGNDDTPNGPTGCNEFNCFRGPSDTFQGSIQCVVDNAKYLQNMPTDRWIDRYGPFCDNETLGLPFAYNLMRFYDANLPPGTPGGRTCGALPPAGVLPGDEALFCYIPGTDKVVPGLGIEERHLHPRYPAYRGAMISCPIPTSQQIWTVQNSGGIARVSNASELSINEARDIIRPLAEKMHTNVVYSGMRLSNTPIDKVEYVLAKAYIDNFNPYVIIGIWGTESWFGQFKPSCNVY